MVKVEQTQCKRGHPYDERNTMWSTGSSGKPQRTCRTCRNARVKLAYHEKKRSAS